MVSDFIATLEKLKVRGSSLAQKELPRFSTRPIVTRRQEIPVELDATRHVHVVRELNV